LRWCRAIPAEEQAAPTALIRPSLDTSAVSPAMTQICRRVDASDDVRVTIVACGDRDVGYRYDSCRR
jgi:hypothetical protein